MRLGCLGPYNLGKRIQARWVICLKFGRTNYISNWYGSPMLSKCLLMRWCGLRYRARLRRSAADKEGQFVRINAPLTAKPDAR
jgi:hypothetical protein